MLRSLKDDLEVERESRRVREMGRLDAQILDALVDDERMRKGMLDMIAPLGDSGREFMERSRRHFRDLGTL